MDPPPIFSLWVNTLRTVSRTPAPQAGRLAAGQVPSPVSSFLNLVQVPVDRSAHIRYTGLAFSFDSQTKNKATSEIWKPFRAPNLAHFYGLILQRTLVFISKWSSKVIDNPYHVSLYSFTTILFLLLLSTL